MKASQQLSPTGVAESLFPRTSSTSHARQDAAFLLNATEDHDLTPSTAYLASELVDLQPDLNATESRALLCLVLISLFNQRQGSTYLPLNTTESPFLLDSLTTLIPTKLVETDKTWSPQHILTNIQNLIAQNRAPLIIGQPDDYKPLIIDGQNLYHQRMLHNEIHLVDLLARHIDQPARTLDKDPELSNIRSALNDVLAHAPQRPDGQRMTLNPEQQYAILTAIHAPLSIITGGPGTGKTSIVVSILRMLTRLGIPTESIALAAPTGKAANRMGESILSQLTNISDTQSAKNTPALKADVELLNSLTQPKTLHRLLSYSPYNQTFSHHENNPLDAQFVIVDEASMIDLFLMKHLVAAISPHTNLILLGDSEQLPSVDTGAILRDLLPTFTDSNTPWRQILAKNAINHLNATNVSRETIPHQHPQFLEPLAQNAVRLTTSYRMDTTQIAGRQIHTLAAAINDPNRTTPLTEIPNPTDHTIPLIALHTHPDHLKHHATELFQPSSEASLTTFVDHWFTTRITQIPNFDALIRTTYSHDGTTFDPESIQRLTTLFDHINTARVLTLTRVHTTGSAKINAAFHNRFLQTRTDGQTWDYVAGEPVLMLHNDYDRGLFNGDQGIILWIRPLNSEKSELTVVFFRDGQFVPYNLNALRTNIEHAFAMTVHKAQGSEFKHVALILPNHDIPLLTREILYTAVSRASHAITIIGKPDLLETGAHRTTRRFSNIAPKLAKILPPKAAPENHKKTTKKGAPKAPQKPIQGSLFSFDD